MNELTDVYVSLGANLDNPYYHITTCIAQLHHLPNTRLINASRLHQTAAVTAPNDPQPQPDYLNAVVHLQTSLSPHALLGYLRYIEQCHGRTRTKRWAARTLDCDILLFGELTMQTDSLTIPHPRMFERDFVMKPLSEVLDTTDIPAHSIMQAEKA